MAELDRGIGQEVAADLAAEQRRKRTATQQRSTGSQAGPVHDHLLYFGPIQRRIRGRFDFGRVAEPMAKMQTNKWPQPIPGQRLSLDTARQRPARPRAFRIALPPLYVVIAHDPTDRHQPPQIVGDMLKVMDHEMADSSVDHQRMDR